ncbi:hypothetical protein [Sphingopyxis sp.]|uniref:hypothetical protein n=1 Tax=Sphingopyxis sp. TaxID=1908224 RepID=UPI003D104E33
MKDVEASRSYEVEIMGESDGKCDCCGNESRRVWGMVHKVEGPTVAAYWMHWTVGHLNEPGANLDLVLGHWGDGTTANDRFGVALRHREQYDEPPSIMVIDPADRPFSDRGLAATLLARSDVIGTPIAAQVFSIIDAIYQQDGRFF